MDAAMDTGAVDQLREVIRDEIQLALHEVQQSLKREAAHCEGTLDVREANFLKSVALAMYRACVHLRGKRAEGETDERLEL